MVKNTIGNLAEELEKYGKPSIYPTGRTNKEGQDVYGIAFYYDGMDGKKKRFPTKLFWGRKPTPIIFHYFDEPEKLLQKDGSRKNQLTKEMRILS